MRTSRFAGEIEYLRDKGRADWAKARHTHNREMESIWQGFRREAAKIRTELEKAVVDSHRVDPDALDASAVKLLESGILTADDVEGLFNKYDGNPTMIRLIGKCAGEMSEKIDPENTKDRTRLFKIADAARCGSSDIVCTFDALEQTATQLAHCNDLLKNPYAPQCAAAWENISGDIIENF